MIDHVRAARRAALRMHAIAPLLLLRHARTHSFAHVARRITCCTRNMARLFL